MRSMALTQSYYSWDSIWLPDSTGLPGSLVAAWLTMLAGQWKGKGTLALQERVCSNLCIPKQSSSEDHGWGRCSERTLVVPTAFSLWQRRCTYITCII